MPPIYKLPCFNGGLCPSQAWRLLYQTGSVNNSNSAAYQYNCLLPPQALARLLTTDRVFTPGNAGNRSPFIDSFYWATPKGDVIGWSKSAHVNKAQRGRHVRYINVLPETEVAVQLSLVCINNNTTQDAHRQPGHLHNKLLSEHETIWTSGVQNGLGEGCSLWYLPSIYTGGGFLKLITIAWQLWVQANKGVGPGHPHMLARHSLGQD